MSPTDKPVVWLHGEVQSPPFTAAARQEAGYLLRLLQQGMKIGLPQSRPMPSLGARCHELRVVDENVTWRIMYRIDIDAVVILEVFEKKHRKTPRIVVDACKDRLKRYDAAQKARRNQ